uniref:Sodium channel modifier 1 n=1 Tax=Oryza rufipogon TaxID=4529 RepID=A0A0E0QKA0_ORYRU
MPEVDPPPSAADLAPRIHIGMEWRSRGQIEMERCCPCRIGKEAKVQAKDVMALMVAVAVPMEEAEVQVEEVAMLTVEVAVPTEEIMAPSRGVCAYDGGGGGHCDGGAAHGATEWRRHRAWAAPAFLRRERRRGKSPINRTIVASWAGPNQPTSGCSPSYSESLVKAQVERKSGPVRVPLLLVPGGDCGGGGGDANAEMSVFGGDRWARDARQRKRRLDDLMLPASAASPSSSSPDSFRRLSNGKFACLVCPHRPVLDSPLMLSMHNKGSRHIAAESRLREKELSRQQEINKRLAISPEASVSSSGKQHYGVRSSDMKEKPLIQQTRQAILEAQSSRFIIDSANKKSHDLERTSNSSLCDSQVTPSVPMEKWSGDTVKGKFFAGDRTATKMLAEEQADFQKRQEQELKFTASGWKRDGHGRWYRDENVEFDSDEDDPNICLG